jgi:hypothetical protein
MFVPKEVVDDDIKNTILQQNNLTHIEDSTLHIKFTKRTGQVVIEVSRNLRKELLALHKLKIQWSLYKVDSEGLAVCKELRDPVIYVYKTYCHLTFMSSCIIRTAGQSIV